MWNKVRERSYEGTASREKEDFQTNLSGYLSALCSGRCLLALALHFPIHTVSKTDPQYPEFVDSLSTLLMKSLVAIYTQHASSSRIFHSPSLIDFLLLETGNSISENEAKQTRILRNLLSNTTLKFYYFAAMSMHAPRLQFSKDIITLAFILLHSHSILKRICTKQEKKLNCSGKFSYIKESKKTTSFL